MSEDRRTPRVLVGLGDIAGQFSTITLGLRALGVDARFHNLSANPLAQSALSGASSSRTAWLMRLRYAPQGSMRARAWHVLLRANRAVRRIRAAILFPWAVVRYDAFILAGHETFLGGPDLWLLRRLGKKIIVIFTGSDHRPPYLSGIGHRDNPDSRSMAAATRGIARRVRHAERGAATIVALPASAQLHRRPFVDFLAVGIPFVPPDHVRLGGEEPPSAGPRDALRVLHAPTEPGPKGTAQIRAVVEQCRREGVALDYRELVGRPNAEVLDMLSRCDFVIDELYSDTPMAKFAVEAAYYGKPTIVGSYALDVYADRRGALPPVHMCHPDALHGAVMKLAGDEAYRVELGRRAREFVLEHWTPPSVANRLLRILADDVPADWLVAPTEVTYVRGWGLSEAALRGRLRRFIREQGFDALCLRRGSRVAESILALASDERDG